MAAQAQTGTGPDARRIGRDELNLAEFPFALVAHRPPKDAPHTLEFRDGTKEWVVEGSAKYGLPTAGDVAVYVVLMELTRQQGFPLQVKFTRHEVLRRLGWEPSGHNYDRLVQALDRLVGVTIRSKNAFYDASQRLWERKKAFHILEEYDITDSRHSRADEPSLFPSWVRWGSELYRNMQAGYIKSLDIDLFLSLESAISQALYRYLDAKRYDGKPTYRIGLHKLAWEHLGLSRNYYPSQIKRKLDIAHKELIGIGFLAGADYASMKSGEDMVVYHFGGRQEKRLAETAPVPLTETATVLCPLAQRLVECGVSRQAAQELAAAMPEECERQLDFLAYRGARDKGAVLVKSIREGWGAPPAWTEAREKAEAAGRLRRKSEEAASQAQVRSRADTEWESWWNDLSPAQRDELEADATAALRKDNRVLADFAAKHPDSPIYREALRDYLKQAAGWTGRE